MMRELRHLQVRGDLGSYACSIDQGDCFGAPGAAFPLGGGSTRTLLALWRRGLLTFETVAYITPAGSDALDQAERERDELSVRVAALRSRVDLAGHRIGKGARPVTGAGPKPGGR